MGIKTMIKNWLGLGQTFTPHLLAVAKVYNNGDEPISWDGFGIQSVEWIEELQRFHVKLAGDPIGDQKFVGFATSYVGFATASHTNAEDGQPLIIVSVIRREDNAVIRENFNILVVRVAE
jgi:hypothetical protein